VVCSPGTDHPHRTDRQPDHDNHERPGAQAPGPPIAGTSVCARKAAGCVTDRLWSPWTTDQLAQGSTQGLGHG
jgi:hypothetical protein